MKETPNIDPNIKAMTTQAIFDRMALAQQEYGKYFGWKAAANFLRDMAGLQYAQENDEKAEMLRSTAKILDGELSNVYQEWANRYKHVIDAYWIEIELRQQAEDERQQKERPNVTAIPEPEAAPEDDGDWVEGETGLDYDEWVASQPWPDGATHATMDARGGCCWWEDEPTLDATFRYAAYGWYGNLRERYYDPSVPFRGVAWQESLRKKLVEDFEHLSLEDDDATP